MWADVLDAPLVSTARQDVAFEIGRFYYGIREYQNALKFYRDSSENVGQHHVTFHNMGLCYYSMGENRPHVHTSTRLACQRPARILIACTSIGIACYATFGHAFYNGVKTRAVAMMTWVDRPRYVAKVIGPHQNRPSYADIGSNRLTADACTLH